MVSKSRNSEEKKSRIFIFHGDDTFTIAEKVRYWMKEFEKKYKNTPTVIDGQNLSGEKLMQAVQDALRADTLFDSVRLIIIKNVFTLKKSDAELIHPIILDQFEKISDTRFVVVCEETIDKRMSFYKKCTDLQKKNTLSMEEFKIPAREALEQWISNQLKKKDARMDPQAYRAFVSCFSLPEHVEKYLDECPYDLWHVNNELEKLISYAGRSLITAEMVEVLVPPLPTSHVFECIESLMSRHPQSAYTHAHALLPNNPTQIKSEFLGMLSFLQSQMRDFLIVKNLFEEGASPAHSAEILAWNPKRLWVVQRKIHSWSASSLCAVYKELIVIEKLAKSSSFRVPILLDRVVASFMRA
ncbi:MAG: hypothetical protein Q7R79_03465 [bacterium]|nr:hypothetical protein [bacterium]